MDNLAQRFAAMPQLEVPPELHQQVMRGVSLYRWRRWLRYPLALVCLNVVVTAWYFVYHMIDNDVPGVISDLLQDFRLDFSYLQYTWDILRAVMPTGWLVALCVNLVLVVVTARMYFSVSKQLHTGRVMQMKQLPM